MIFWKDLYRYMILFKGIVLEFHLFPLLYFLVNVFIVFSPLSLRHLLSLGEHRASTMALHLALFGTIHLASSQDGLFVSSCSSVIAFN